MKPDPRPGLGALGGLYTALSEACYEMVVVVACDMPFVNPTLLKIQIETLRFEAADVVIPRLPEGFEPMHAVYRKRTCLPAVEQAIQSDQRRMISWFDAVTVREMLPEEIRGYGVEMNTFMNINDPVQFAAAERLARDLEENQ
jgi:molybdopterin-guanine dinucleotide biosynthesis protein A